MSLTHFFYEPFYSLSDFDRLFEDAFNARGTIGNGPAGSQVQRRDATSGIIRPKIDVHENKDANTITASFELPGLKKDDVNIDVHNNVLTVSGESKMESERSEEGFAVRERRYGKFSRSVPLPQGVKIEEVKAKMDNGVLTVNYPKSAPESAPKKIAIA